MVSCLQLLLFGLFGIASARFYYGSDLEKYLYAIDDVQRTRDHTTTPRPPNAHPLSAPIDRLIYMHNTLANQGHFSYFVRRNNVSHLSSSQYSQLLGFRPDLVPKNKETNLLESSEKRDIPDEVDWRKEGVVTSVKNQGNCGSCWSFSAAGALEGQHARATGDLIDLSEQNLLDCDKSDDGCDGGVPANAFLYVKQNGGIDTERAYPYEAMRGACRFKTASVGAEDTGYARVLVGDEEALKEAVAMIGPISIAIDASHPGFSAYERGVYYEPKCGNRLRDLDHAVLLVGYGTDEQYGDYWLVKNSWGEGWGEQGYIRMARNKKNHCGVATFATVPLV